MFSLYGTKDIEKELPKSREEAHEVDQFRIRCDRAESVHDVSARTLCDLVILCVKAKAKSNGELINGYCPQNK